MKIIARRNNIDDNSIVGIAESISSKLGVNLIMPEILKLSGYESKISLHENLGGEGVVILYTTNFPVNDSMFELFLLIDVVKKKNPGKVTVIFTYLGYLRHDALLDDFSSPISVISKTLKVLGVDDIAVVEAHSCRAISILQSATENKIVNISTVEVFIKAILDKYKNLQDIVIISPDTGSKERARIISERLKVPYIVMDKTRNAYGSIFHKGVSAEVEDKRCIIIDDIVDRANTLLSATKALIIAGALEVHAYATHGLFAGSSLDMIEMSRLKSLVVTNTLDIDIETAPKKLEVIKIDDTLIDYIKSIAN